MDVLMAGAADDQGLAAACCHLLDPCGLLGPPLASEILEMPDVMHFDLLPRATEFAGIGEKPLRHLGMSAVPDAGGIVVEGNGRGLACERDAAHMHQAKK